MGQKEKLFLLKLNEIKKLIEANRPRAEIARFLGVKYDTLSNYFKKYGIVYNGNQNRRGIPHNESRKSLEDILNNKIIYSTSSLKKRLIEERLKENKCEVCGISNWNGKELQLELHHIDGNHYNNKLENLQILCPNCHSQTERFRGRQTLVSNITEIESKNNIKDVINEINKIIINKNSEQSVLKSDNIKDKRYCDCCGKELKKGQKKYCSYSCSYKSTSKRPSKNELINKLSEYKNNKSAIGRYYGVSDNAVKKWMKKYDLI